jgi:hypothetical protein
MLRGTGDPLHGTEARPRLEKEGQSSSQDAAGSNGWKCLILGRTSLRPAVKKNDSTFHAFPPLWRLGRPPLLT